jgi:hypothetical protein
MLFSAFTSSRPGTLLATDHSSSDRSAPQQTSELNSFVDDSSGGTFRRDDSDADSLVDDESEFNAQTNQTNTICYEDIKLFLLRNPDNLERDIRMAEVEFRNLKGRPEGVDR